MIFPRTLTTLFACLLLAGTAAAQTFQFSGGASNLLQSEGATATMYTPGSTSLVSLGMSNGHLVAAAQTDFRTRFCEVIAGDQQIFLSGGETGLGITARAISCHRKHVTFFVGAVGRAFSAPYFNGMQAADFGTGVSYERTFHEIETGGVLAVAAGRITAVESAQRRWQHFTLHGLGGLLDSSLQFGGRAEMQYSHFAAVAGRTTYFVQNQSATTNDFGISATAGNFGAHASAFLGRSSGQAVGASYLIGPARFSVDEYLAHSGKIFVATATESLRRWTISQHFTRSNGTSAFSFGGGYAGNLISASADYQEMFFPFATRAPFQKVLTVTIALQLPHSISTHTNLQAAPGQRLGFTAYGAAFLATGTQLAHTAGGKIGGVEFSGIVESESGAPVEGAALQIGPQEVFTDAAGHWMARFPKARPQPVSLVLGDFLMPGDWTVVSCPATATESPIRCILAHR
ncbi:MAG TPA: hypothetical protein VMI32_07075 [Candidatus Solibacter sp.]|nr:hypothetical protein [Candidatus Solibacter sp.]